MTAVLVETDDAPDTVDTPYGIAPGDFFEGSIGIEGDLDWVAITLEAGRVYEFSLDGRDPAGLVDPFLYLYDSEGTLIAQDDDSGGNLNSFLSYAPGASGVYFLGAAGYSFETIGNYRLGVTVEPDEGPTDAPADTSATTAVPVDGSLTGSLSASGDEDWFRVELEAGETYAFKVAALSGLDPVMTLYDAAGDPVLSADDGGTFFDSRVLYALDAPGVYFLGIAGGAAGDAGDYRLSVDRGATNGTRNDDRILLDEDSTFARGRGGDDTLTGNDRANSLYGDRGADLIEAGNGRDFLNGGVGRDRLFGEAGRDTVDGGGSNDLLRGGSGADILAGSGGRDRLNGQSGDDTLDGGGGRDLLRGGVGADTFRFGRDGGTDRIVDFDLSEDILALATRLVGPDATGAEIVDLYGDIVDGSAVLTFKFGTAVVLEGVTDLDSLAAAISVA